ncbi:SOS response-associated peptidase [Tanticharoenia sakaeratensis]|jgi:putative SOS response-associated peptidase YedK|uniref:Abasic site processing protein n=1 Tax=Tanticharoenia sakaeratensis NBRC 103193 TaxID=1231623 RepID=A0A0D6MPC4_9PROT|nr:SOS response-associated peptidase [Tanticharoenia sakaeratensis]GAN55544.1 hypothetical protein Tasa_048_169 [Tanticharoenia sakaeratensis NBRC 103193]GBQ21774.1 hypothetical protein AA103193_1843 [Tanticharoenia sakaeratensis NBRC 103193]
MCNLYSMTSNQQAIRDLAGAMQDRTGNLAPLPSIYPDQSAPIVQNGADGREMVMARWGMPSPAFALAGKKTDRGVTNIRNTASPHWRRWLSPQHRCVVPWTSFSEMARQEDGTFEPVWFAADDDRPLRFFAGLHTTWTSVRKIREGEITADLFGFLTTEANDIVRPYHPKAMPVVLETADEVDVWLDAPWDVARTLQRPLRDAALTVVQA